jgi:hypothetical protein
MLVKRTTEEVFSSKSPDVFQTRPVEVQVIVVDGMVSTVKLFVHAPSGRYKAITLDSVQQLRAVRYVINDMLDELERLGYTVPMEIDEDATA